MKVTREFSWNSSQQSSSLSVQSEHNENYRPLRWSSISENRMISLNLITEDDSLSSSSIKMRSQQKITKNE